MLFEPKTFAEVVYVASANALVINSVPAIAVNVDVGKFMLNALFPVQVLVPDNVGYADIPETCVSFWFCSITAD
jgi:Ni/Fe-hydrogenase subunit HybB-like protein